MNEITEPKPKRKTLSLKLAKPEAPEQPCFVAHPNAVYMVWIEGGDMPTRVYRSGERSIAVSHAKKLTEQTGRRFHVLRSFRAFDPV